MTEKVKIEYVSVEKLRGWNSNPRVMTEQQHQALRTSIKEFGFVEPVVINRDNMIIGGHQRVEDAQKVGLKAVPCIRVDLPPRKWKALNLALNRIHGEWDLDKLAPILLELKDFAEIDLTGFQPQEIDTIIRETLPEQNEKDDIVLELSPEPITKLGNLWQLGKHRILCGDSTKPEDVSKLMQHMKAILFATDPPYGVAYDSTAGKPEGHKRLQKWQDIDGDDQTGPDIQPFLEKTFRIWLPYLADNAAWYLWHGMLTQAFYAAAAAAAASVILHRQIIWVKPRFIIGHGDYHWQHELCFYEWRQGHRPPFYGERNQSTIWQEPYDEGRRNAAKYEHPTQKPTILWEIPIMNNTLKGETIADPFLGSGTSLIAAEKLGRVCYGMEIEPRYVDVAVKRWENFTGRKADCNA